MRCLKHLPCLYWLLTQYSQMKDTSYASGFSNPVKKRITIWLFLIKLIVIFQAGSQWLEMCDTYAGGWNVLVIAFCECVCIGYVYGKIAFNYFCIQQGTLSTIRQFSASIETFSSSSSSSSLLTTKKRNKTIDHYTKLLHIGW